jgi:hypothetical protein
MSLSLSDFASAQSATPVVSSVSGSWTHGTTVTIQGSGFGTKPTAAPVVWDDCSGTNPLDKWDGVWPTPSSSTQYQLTYRAPMRGVSPPHSRVGRYLAGAHGCSSLDCANIMAWKSRTVSSTAYSYVSWYQRADPNWVFSGCDGAGSCDDNFKTTSWATGHDAPWGEPFWYSSYNPSFKSATGFGGWATSTLPGRQYNWGEPATNLFREWVKVELIARWSTGSDGFVRMYDNGRLVFEALGPNDYGSGTARTESIGGYARQYGQPNNWRYFADLYLDHSLAHVILGNAPTLAASTRREVQIPSAWSSSSVSVRVNLGAFANGQTAYVYIVNSSGVANSVGYPATIGGGSPPSAPTGLRILR